MSAQSDQRTGLVYGFVAYGLWGVLPLYWHLLSAASPTEILASRMAWSLPVALIMLAALRRWSWIRPLLRQPKRLGLVVVAAAVISVNWYLYIWAVNSGHVLEASLGYFINPLVSIAFGVIFLRERLRPLQWAAVGVGTLAVLIMAVAYGRVPWIALLLAFSFATYGLVKKGIQLGGIEGFGTETAIQFLPALACLVLLGVRGESGFVSGGIGQSALLAGSGLATALPLIAFGMAAVRLPLSMLGMLQYLAPTFQFVLGITVFHEAMPPERWTGFVLVWLALAFLTWDALRTARSSRTALATARASAARSSAAGAVAEGAGPAAVAATPDGSIATPDGSIGTTDGPAAAPTAEPTSAPHEPTGAPHESAGAPAAEPTAGTAASPTASPTKP
ncbi:EamA family transporter RarD [Streptomyces olivaceiscleroticus]|uniref:EamA domain-containing protein n=1 Tax=Streptomyces olivaceiscleroticus TaxID=68245 RepID=A0ABN1BCF7_9ACTN